MTMPIFFTSQAPTDCAKRSDFMQEKRRNKKLGFISIPCATIYDGKTDFAYDHTLNFFRIEMISNALIYHFFEFSRFVTCCENNFKFKIFGNLQWGLDNVFCNIDSWLFLSILMAIIKDKKSILIYKKSRIHEYQKFFKIQDEQFLFGVCKEIELHGRDHLTYNLESQTSFF